MNGENLKSIVFDEKMSKAILLGKKTMVRQPIDGTCPPYKVGEIVPVYIADAKLSVDFKESAELVVRIDGIETERLRSIKLEDCVDEGAVTKPHFTKRGDLCLHSRYKTEFSILWDSTIKKSDIDRYGWEANPWVWAISFERCEKPEGWPQ